MLNGVLQSMMTNIVPGSPTVQLLLVSFSQKGNRNADNIDAKLRSFDRIVYLNRSLETYGFRAALLKSFGFGQVGGEVLGTKTASHVLFLNLFFLFASYSS